MKLENIKQLTLREILHLTEDKFSIDKTWKISDAKILSTSLAPLIEKTKRNGNSPIEDLIMDYLNDKISYSQFKDSIEEYKNTIEYFWNDKCLEKINQFVMETE